MPKKIETSIRAGAFEGFRSLLWEYGIDPDDVFMELGLDSTAMSFPECLVPVNTYRCALNLAAKYTGQPHFGLLMSQRHTLHKFGAIGYLMMHSATVGQSIACLDKYLRIHDSSSVSRMEIQDDTVLWTVNFTALGDETALQHAELGMGLAAKIIRIIHSEKWSPDAVYFEHTKPQCTKLHERIFQCPVLFDQATNGLEFPERLLKEKLPTADPSLFNIIQSHIDGIEKKKGGNFIDQVRQSIQTSFEDGKPSLEKTAKQFSTSAAQFQRKLKQDGTNYQDILQEVRHALACKYLSDTDMPLATISTLLAYAEPAVFSRAFRRNFNMAPRDWRRQNAT